MLAQASQNKLNVPLMRTGIQRGRGLFMRISSLEGVLFQEEARDRSQPGKIMRY